MEPSDFNKAIEAILDKQCDVSKAGCYNEGSGSSGKSEILRNALPFNTSGSPSSHPYGQSSHHPWLFEGFRPLLF